MEETTRKKLTRWIATALTIVLVVLAVLPMEANALIINGAGSGVSGAAGGWAA